MFSNLLDLFTEAQSVRCGSKDWLCIDGRNRENISEEVLSNPVNTLDNGISAAEPVVTIADNEATTTPAVDNNNNTTNGINDSTTPTSATETPVESTEKTNIENGKESVKLMSDGFPKPFPAQYQQVWK